MYRQYIFLAILLKWALTTLVRNLFFGDIKYWYWYFALGTVPVLNSNWKLVFLLIG